MKRITTLLSLLLSTAIITACGGNKTSVPLNFGDGSAASLMYQIGVRKGAGDWDQVVIYSDKIIENFSAKAKDQQASLSAYPTKDIWKYDALNNVAHAYIHKANAQTMKSDKAGARLSYDTIIRDYGFAQYKEVGKWIKAAEIAERRAGKL